MSIESLVYKYRSHGACVAFNKESEKASVHITAGASKADFFELEYVDEAVQELLLRVKMQELGIDKLSKAEMLMLQVFATANIIKLGD